MPIKENHAIRNHFCRPPPFKLVDTRERKSIQDSLRIWDIGVDLNTANWIECDDAKEALALLKRQRGLGCIFVFEPMRSGKFEINVIAMVLSDKRFSLQKIAGKDLWTNRSVKSIMDDTDQYGYRSKKQFYYAEGDVATRERLRKQREKRDESQSGRPYKNDTFTRDENYKRYKKQLVEKHAVVAKQKAKQLCELISKHMGLAFADAISDYLENNPAYKAASELGKDLTRDFDSALSDLFNTPYADIQAIYDIANGKGGNEYLISKLAQADLKKIDEELSYV